MVNLLFTISTAEGGFVVLLEDVIVHHEFRGRGVGSQLLNHAIEYAKRKEFLRMTLLTDRITARRRRTTLEAPLVAEQLAIDRVKTPFTLPTKVVDAIPAATGGVTGTGAAGYRVGSYTSPHLLRYNERICIDGEPVADTVICGAFAAIDRCRADTTLSFFEFGTLAALRIFAAAGVEVLVYACAMSTQAVGIDRRIVCALGCGAVRRGAAGGRLRA